jgi:hypothetical protein
MILKAQAAFTTAKTGEQTKIVDGRTETVELRQVDGGLEITGEIIPDTPLEHEMLVALLDHNDAEEYVTFAIEPVTEKITFLVRAAHAKDIVAEAHARLQDRKDAENAGLPLHIHLEQKATKEAAQAKAAVEAAQAPLVSDQELAAARDAGRRKALLQKAEADGAAEVLNVPPDSAKN